MPDATGPLLSVRGEARRVVAPDVAELHGRLALVREGRAATLLALRAEQEALLDELRARGGAPLDIGPRRAALAWSVHSVATTEVYDHDDRGRASTTGRVEGALSLEVMVRDLGLVEEVAEVVAGQPFVDLHGITWGVDHDNAAWGELHAEAVRAAVARARAYAVALGADLVSLLHVADVGLLGGAGEPVPTSYGARLLLDRDPGGGSVGVPSLDPVPRELVAAVEARLRATPVDLGLLPAAP